MSEKSYMRFDPRLYRVELNVSDAEVELVYHHESSGGEFSMFLTEDEAKSVGRRLLRCSEMLRRKRKLRKGR